MRDERHKLQEMVRNAALLDKIVEGKIRRRAYELYEVRGRQSGRELEDWLRAEAEIRSRPSAIDNVIPFRPLPK